MRIIIIGPVNPYRGGISHFTMNLFKALENISEEVIVISFKKQYPKFLYPGNDDKNFDQKIFPRSLFTIRPFNPHSWLKTTKLISDFSPDLVLFQWWTTFWAIPFGVMIRLLKRKKIKINYIVHNVLPHEERLNDKRLVRFALGKVDKFFVQMPSEKKRLESIFPNPKKSNFEIIQLSHPIYDNFSEQKISPQDARRKLGLPSSDYIILFFGIVRKYKGLNILIDSLGQLKKKEHNPLLLVAGEFWDSRKEIETNIKNQGLSQNIIIFNRYIPDNEVPIFFSASNLFVAPYIGGTQSGAMKIAMSFNLPIIASNHIISENEKNYKYLYPVPKKDPIALSNAILYFMNLKNSNQNSLEKLFTWKQFAEAIISYL